MEEIKDPTTDYSRQRIFGIFFDNKKRARSVPKDKTINSTYYRIIDGIPDDIFRAAKAQLLQEGLLIDNGNEYCPTIKGEAFYKSGGFSPNWFERINRFVKKNSDTILSVVAIIVSVIAILRTC